MSEMFRPEMHRLCHDCAAKPGDLHESGCDVERCPNCGNQFISCDCDDEELAELERLPWTGEWPGVSEAKELGFFCRWGDNGGWVKCSKDHPRAMPDLNRLVCEGVWSKQLKKFIRKA